MLVAPEPECVTVRLRRQWVCAPGSAGAGNPQAVSAPRMRGPTPSPRTAGWPGCLSGPCSRPASLSARPLAGPRRFPRARRPREAAPGVLAPSGSLCLRLPATALDRDYGRGVLCGLLPWEESARSPTQPLFWMFVGRAWAATGEGRGLAARGAHPQLASGTPKPWRGGRRRWGQGQTGGGFAQKAGRGRSRPGGGARGRVPGRPGTFPRQGAGAGPPPPHQQRGLHVVADETPAPPIFLAPRLKQTRPASKNRGAPGGTAAPKATAPLPAYQLGLLSFCGPLLKGAAPPFRPAFRRPRLLSGHS